MLRDGLLFGYAATKLNCLDAKTGKVLWADTANPGQGASVVDAGSCLIALTVNGELSVYLPSDKQYTELAHYKGDPEIVVHSLRQEHLHPGQGSGHPVDDSIAGRFRDDTCIPVQWRPGLSPVAASVP